MSVIRFLLALLAALASGLGGCGAESSTPPPLQPPPPPPSTFSWDEPADYTFTVDYVIFGPAYGTYVMTVRDHDVVAVEGANPETQLRVLDGAMPLENARTIAEILADAERAVADPDGDATVLWNDLTGDPETVAIDWIVLAVDDEEWFGISDVEIP